MKIYAYIAVVLAFLGYSWGMYHMGGAGCREDSANAAREHGEKQTEGLVKLEDEKKTREVIYVDKIRVVREANADCLSVPMPDDVWMQLSNGSPKQPTPDP